MALTQQQNIHDIPNSVLIIGNIEANQITAHTAFKVGSTATAPALAAGAQAGTSPPAPVLTAGSTDLVGQCTFGTGATPALGGQVAVTFGTALAVAPRTVIINALNDATGLKIVYAVSLTTTGFIIDMAVAPAASQANTVYSVSWFVVV